MSFKWPVLDFLSQVLGVPDHWMEEAYVHQHDDAMETHWMRRLQEACDGFKML